MKYHLMSGKGQWFNTDGGWSDSPLHAVVFEAGDKGNVRLGRGEYFIPLRDDPQMWLRIAGREFWQNRDGLWNVSNMFDGPPKNFAYKYAQSIADLKNIQIPKVTS